MLNARDEVLGLLEQMRAVAACPRMDALSDQMETLVRSYLEPTVDGPVAGIDLTPLEYRVYARLRDRMGVVATNNQLMDAMYFDRVNNEPDPKMVAIYVHRIRAKLPHVRIENARGAGYRMVRDVEA